MREDIRRYHTVAMSLHWLIGALILVNLTIGIGFDFMAKPDLFFYLQLHKSIGLTVLLLTVLRIVWRLAKGAPPEPSSLPVWQKVVSSVVHFLIYVLMFMIPFSGWALASASPKRIPTVLFWTVPWPNLPGFENLPDLKAKSEQIGEVHQWLAYSMIVLLVLHVGAALWHHWMQKDGILFRMTPPWAEGALRRLRGEKG